MTRKELPWLSAQGTRLKREDGSPILLRGFGLGGWLLPEGYMWRMHPAVDRPRRMEALITRSCGADWAAEFWRRYRQSFITEADIRYIAAGGFNSVRLPFNSRTLFRIEDDRPVFNGEALRHLDSCLGWCRKAGIYLILDMHGAPGGQTGTNIDDSPADLPELFLNTAYQDQCVAMWGLLAARYAEEPTVAGYDLLNEPLAPPFTALAQTVLPLYRRIRDAIRAVDRRHLIILEGVRWATDIHIFEDLVPGDFDDNWMLQFHKYWNDPYEASIQSFLEARERLQVPLYMGEGGENNLAWYSAAFPMLESNDVSWNFWTYKKMDCHNSPISFPRPPFWPPAPTPPGPSTDEAHREDAGEDAGAEADAASTMDSRASARSLWEAFLAAIDTGSTKNPAVFRALDRQVPLALGAESYDQATILHARKPGAQIRQESEASILFIDGHQGQPDFRRMAGEDQAEEQRLCVELLAGEELLYALRGGEKRECRVSLSFMSQGDCILHIRLDGEPGPLIAIHGPHKPGTITTATSDLALGPGRHSLGLRVAKGSILLHRILIEEAT